MKLNWNLLVIPCFALVFMCNGMEQQQGRNSSSQYETFSINSSERVSLLSSRSAEDITVVPMPADSWVITMNDAVRVHDLSGVTRGGTRSGATRKPVPSTTQQQLAQTFEILAQKLQDAESNSDVNQMQKGILQVILANLKQVKTETNVQVSQESCRTRIYAVAGILGMGALQIAYQIVSQYLNGTLCKDS